MPPLRDVTDPPGVEWALRLAERRRLDRQERTQWWIVVLLAAWLLTQAATAAAVAIAIGPKQTNSYLWRPLSEVVGPMKEAFASFAELAAGGCGLLTFTVAAVVGIVALWNRRTLPAVWFVVGVTPWLILVVEAAGLAVFMLWRVA